MNIGFKFYKKDTMEPLRICSINFDLGGHPGYATFLPDSTTIEEETTGKGKYLHLRKDEFVVELV